MLNMRSRILSVLTMICSLLVGAAVAFAQSDGTFAISTKVEDGLLVPTLTWDTGMAACTASGDSEWEGPKPASGTETLSGKPTTQPRSFALMCGSPEDVKVFLTWIPPTANTDGSPLTNLAGYRVYWGQSQTALTQTAQINNPATTSYTIENLAPGTWYFGVRAFTTIGAESAMTQIVSKTTKAATEWSAQTGIKVPAAVEIVSVE